MLPALYPAAAAGLRNLADKGYIGAGIGILVPIKGSNLAPDNRARNTLISALRACGRTCNALLKRTSKHSNAFTWHQAALARFDGRISIGFGL